MNGAERRPIADLPRALDRRDELAERIGPAPAVFLDYDGTLTPITDDPSEARLSQAMRQAIDRLKDVCTTGVVSGRDLGDVRELVGVNGIYYAGSHGFEIVEPDGTRHVQGESYRPALERGADELERRLEDIPGAFVERKGFAVAVHYRRLRDPSDEPLVERVVAEVQSGEPDLRTTGGKKIMELRPALDWDKGKAILSILDLLERDGSAIVPVYVGDDVTDEDGFRALEGRGLGIVVEGEDDQRGSAADYKLADAEEVRIFLDLVADLATREPPRGADSGERSGTTSEVPG